MAVPVKTAVAINPENRGFTIKDVVLVPKVDGVNLTSNVQLVLAGMNGPQVTSWRLKFDPSGTEKE
jgi:hypothetical protein